MHLLQTNYTNKLLQIASKLELYVANQPSSGDASQATWRKLGSMTFDSNERSSFKARELKSVHVEAGAQLLRVVLHKPHANRMNAHGQVCPLTVPCGTTVCLRDLSELSDTLAVRLKWGNFWGRMSRKSVEMQRWITAGEPI